MTSLRRLSLAQGASIEGEEVVEAAERERERVADLQRVHEAHLDLLLPWARRRSQASGQTRGTDSGHPALQAFAAWSAAPRAPLRGAARARRRSPAKPPGSVLRREGSLAPASPRSITDTHASTRGARRRCWYRHARIRKTSPSRPNSIPDNHMGLVHRDHEQTIRLGPHRLDVVYERDHRGARPARSRGDARGRDSRRAGRARNPAGDTHACACGHRPDDRSYARG